MTIKLSRRKAIQLGAGVLMMGAGGAIVAETPKRGGTLRIGVSGGNTVDVLDSVAHGDAFMQCLASGTIFDCLTKVTSDGVLAGELAESWEATGDAKTWTFKLREAEFHNGKSFSADDVIASIQHHMGENSESVAKPLVSPIEKMTKLDPRTVQFRLAQGNADFPFLMSDYHLLMYPSDDMAGAMQKGTGTGAYVLEDFEPGVRASATRNTNDYRDDRGYFDAVQYIGIRDGTARINALITGEVDLINKVEPKAVNPLRRNSAIFISEVTGNQHYTFPMDTRVAPFNDNNVRMAIKHAINRKEMVAKILSGHGAVANDHPIGPANQYYAVNLEQTSYDPDKAKFYLKQAGFDSLDISLSVSEAAFPGATDAGQLFQQSARATGINLDIVAEPKDGYWVNVWKNKPFTASYWSGRPTEDWIFSSNYAKGVPWNDAFWEHPLFNRLLVKARVELDSDKRGALYHEMQKIVQTDGGQVIPMYANYIDAASDKLRRPDSVSNAWQMDGFRVAERWSFR